MIPPLACTQFFPKLVRAWMSCRCYQVIDRPYDVMRNFSVFPTYCQISIQIKFQLDNKKISEGFFLISHI